MLKRVPHRPYFDPDANVWALSGHAAVQNTLFFRPTPAETRRMLLEIRRKLGIGTWHLAALFGASHNTMRHWLIGERNPSAVARRCIWLMHTLLTNPDALSEDSAWLTWARRNPEVDLEGLTRRWRRGKQMRRKRRRAPSGVTGGRGKPLPPEATTFRCKNAPEPLGR